MRTESNRRNFLRTIAIGVGTVGLAGRLPITKPCDPWQAFLDRIGNKVHGIVLHEGRPMESVVIEPPFEMDGEHWYRCVKVHLEGRGEPYKWFELVTY